MTKSRNLNQPRATWTREREDLLRGFYPHVPTKSIADALGVSTSQVYRKVNLLGLKKSEAFLASVASGRIQRGRQHPSMIAHQFKPGLRPWNTGTHYSAGGRSAETRFKPGRKPQESRNYVPIGSLRISKDGYLERKFTDDTALVPTRRWVGVHRQVWEAANGPIPAGHVIAFKRGQQSQVEAEITLDRLECISRGELARRNHPRSHSPELAHLVLLKGAITRQVNRIAREHHQQQGQTA